MTDTGFEEIAMRQAFGDALVKAGEKNDKLVVLNCDLSGATGTKTFLKAFPDKSFEFGIAEQNAASAAVGFAMEGFRPFVASFGSFLTRRAYDQIYTSAAMSNAGVVYVGTHSGLAIGKDGATQMGINDLAIILAIPANMQVFQPADFFETALIIQYLAENNQLAYLRLSRRPRPQALPSDYKFIPGKAQTIRPGEDIVIFASGDCVYDSLCAAQILQESGIKAAVVNVSTLKPFDKDCVIEYAKKVKGIVAVEDHSITGGLGTLVAETLASEGIGKKLLKIGIIGFGESGDPKDLYRKYGLDKEGIIISVTNFYKDLLCSGD